MVKDIPIVFCLSTNYETNLFQEFVQLDLSLYPLKIRCTKFRMFKLITRRHVN